MPNLPRFCSDEISHFSFLSIYMYCILPLRISVIFHGIELALYVLMVAWSCSHIKLCTKKIVHDIFIMSISLYFLLYMCCFLSSCIVKEWMLRLVL